MAWGQLGRYMLDFAVLYPSAVLCYLPVWRRVRLSPGRLVAAVLCGVTALALGGSLICMRLGWPSNRLLLPVLLLAFLAYRLTLAPDFPLGKAAYVFMTMSALMASCTLMTCMLTARGEADNPDVMFLPSSSLICLGLCALMIALFIPLLRARLIWLMEEFHAGRVWRTAWLFPTCFTAMYCLMQPRYPTTILINRIQILSVILIAASVLVLFILTALFYHIAREITANARLAEENRMLAIEAHRYLELRAHMEETHLMRHDFRQHLRVLSNLANSGELEEMKQYLSQYERKLDGERLSLCANAAVDAIAGYYHHYAAAHEMPIDWELSLQKELPLPETDICMLLGNLMENALRASSRLPVERRSIRVICRMLSPAMLGLIVENAYDGVVKKQGDVFLSSWHDGPGFGLQSVESTVLRYHGKLTIETDNGVFSVNILLNL